MKVVFLIALVVCCVKSSATQSCKGPRTLKKFYPQRIKGRWYGLQIYWPFPGLEIWRDYSNTFTPQSNGSMIWGFDLRYGGTLNFTMCSNWTRDLVPTDTVGKYNWILDGTAVDSLYFVRTDYKNFLITYQKSPSFDNIRMITIWGRKTSLSSRLKKRTKNILATEFCLSNDDMETYMWINKHENRCPAKGER
ncbi:uncharacterized protein LOC106160146 [Lingula anatina]|uniref:Uncharacterized protein LOC106160146 n=1 Tax=Lingula anatina TaxID=7574 RepID=A0A1S3I2R2_LINAN|nr:uncharacterized protein LOC106160146 [Lingula anatina]|eukprot:XP_013392116.1 uncharacterized protein LOC106160146 [Lingula anatina]